jgi:hypothetical protein
MQPEAENKMAKPKVYEEVCEGTPEELERYLQQQQPDERFRLTRVFPSAHQSPAFPTKEPETLSPPRDLELLARVESIRGKYAYLGVSTEDLHRERQKDKEKEERQIIGEKP